MIGNQGTVVAYDGVLVNNLGTVVSVVHGWTDGAKVPQGQTFVAMPDVSAVSPGADPSKLAQQQLSATDYQMARGAEDAIAALIQGTIVPRVTFSATLLGRINTRRLLRNQGTI
jgi:hypothetical protein